MSMLFRINDGGFANPPVKQAQEVQRTKAAALESARIDQVELSEPGNQLTNIEQVRAQRLELIHRVRLEIASNVYETDRKSDIAVDRIFSELTALDVRV